MFVNKANVDALFVNLKTTFNKAFSTAPTLWERTTMLVQSQGAENSYVWLSMFPKMRKWLGEKTVKALAAFRYSIVNDDWEATIQVRRNDIEDDNLGIYGPQAQMAGVSARQLPDEIDADLKNNAFTGKCYDGKAFYATDHAAGGTTFGNKGTLTLSATNFTQAQASYGAARTAIMSITDDEGRPLGLIPNLLEVPPALEAVAKMLCESDKLLDDKPNPYKGTATYIVNPRLTSSTAWFLHVTSLPLKPFVYQERKKPVFVSQTDSSADAVFMRAEYKFSVEARAAGGYGLWQLSYGSTGASAHTS